MLGALKAGLLMSPELDRLILVNGYFSATGSPLLDESASVFASGNYLEKSLS